MKPFRVKNPACNTLVLLFFAEKSCLQNKILPAKRKSCLQNKNPACKTKSCLQKKQSCLQNKNPTCKKTILPAKQRSYLQNNNPTCKTTILPAKKTILPARPCFYFFCRFFSAFAVLFISFWAAFHTLLPRLKIYKINIILHLKITFSGRPLLDLSTTAS